MQGPQFVQSLQRAMTSPRRSLVTWQIAGCLLVAGVVVGLFLEGVLPHLFHVPPNK